MFKKISTFLLIPAPFKHTWQFFSFLSPVSQTLRLVSLRHIPHLFFFPLQNYHNSPGVHKMARIWVFCSPPGWEEKRTLFIDELWSDDRRWKAEFFLTASYFCSDRNILLRSRQFWASLLLRTSSKTVGNVKHLSRTVVNLQFLKRSDNKRCRRGWRGLNIYKT